MSPVISIYPHIRETKKGKDLPVDILFSDIKEGKWQDEVLGVRTNKIKKDSIPYVTLSGKFSERKISGLLHHSGLICIDVDDIEDPEMIKSIICPDPYLYSAFTSVSGKGLALVFKISPEKHQEAFDGLSEYLFTNYQLIIDQSCRDVSRARYISWDPDIYINENCRKFASYPKRDKALTKLPNIVFVQTDFDNTVKGIIEKGIDITGGYQQWLSICFAISTRFKESGRKYFHQISQFSDSYNSKTCDRQYTNCLKARKSGINIATFYYYAKQAGISIISEKTKLISQTAYLANKGKRTKEDTIKLLQEHEGIPVEDSQEIIDQVFDNNIKVESDDIISSIESWLNQNYDFKRNSITRYIELNGEPLQEKDLNSIYINAKKVFETLPYDLFHRIVHSNFTPDFHPFTDFFNKHKDRNPKGVIEAFFDSIESDTGLQDNQLLLDYVLHFGTKWLVSIVSSAFGIHSPLMLVLSGGQGTGKTEFFRRLLPEELHKHGRIYPDYYAESKLDRGKDDEILMTQKLIIMDDEMGGKSKKEETHLKTILSAQTFNLREPYGKNNVNLSRIAVLCGTTNNPQILNDPTGNRRIIPINVLSINFEKYNCVDKIDLLMEAYWLWKSGFKWELTSKDVSILSNHTEQFKQVSIEYELIIKYFGLASIQDTKGKTAEFMTTTDIKAFLEVRSGQKLNVNKIGQELKKIGWERKVSRAKGPVCYGYYVINKELLQFNAHGL